MIRYLLVFFVMTCSIVEADSTSIDFEVAIDSKQKIEKVTLSREDSIHTTELKYDEKNKRYFHKVRVDFLKLPFNYHLVAFWGDSSTEQISLTVRHIPETPIKFTFSKNNLNKENTTHSNLVKIEKMARGFESQLKKYFLSKSFFNFWKHDNNSPQHIVALRSVRAWFDSSYRLSVFNNSTFRMDKDVVALVKEFEKEAKHGSSVGKRWRRVTNPGYISTMLKRLKANEYKYVDQIKKLIKQKRYEQALAYSKRALESYNSETKNDRKSISHFQGVNRNLLIGNKNLSTHLVNNVSNRLSENRL